MGGTNYSSYDYTQRQAHRAATGQSAFVHQQKINSGKVAAGLHADLNPKGVKMRESRDSDAHPVTIPIGVIFDTTGSMAGVPAIIQENLNKLMGTFLDDKSSGKRYLGDAYPSILIGAVDDFDAQSNGYAYPNGDGALQVGQFESGIEIDDNLGKIWFTRNGGGNNGESYDLALYFFARHTAHDHYQKRHKKGYLFIIGDEKFFNVSRNAVASVIGDKIESGIPFKSIVAEASKYYHVYFIMPNMTQHWGDDDVESVWRDVLGERFVKLNDPQEICPFIASLVAMNEGNVDIADLSRDGMSSAVTQALVPLSSSTALAHLPALAGNPGGVKRL